MSIKTPSRKQLAAKIEELPPEALRELAAYIDYLRYKSGKEASSDREPFLLAIAGLGESDERDVSERAEEILADEVDTAL